MVNILPVLRPINSVHRNYSIGVNVILAFSCSDYIYVLYSSRLLFVFPLFRS